MCLAHRLNLFTKDLLECERLTVVKAFCDWFSDRRRQVSFKAFFSQRSVGQKLKCVPQPSDTRWLFTETSLPRSWFKTLWLKRSSKTTTALWHSGILWWKTNKGMVCHKTNSFLFLMTSSEASFSLPRQSLEYLEEWTKFSRTVSDGLGCLVYC